MSIRINVFTYCRGGKPSVHGWRGNADGANSFISEGMHGVHAMENTVRCHSAQEHGLDSVYSAIWQVVSHGPVPKPFAFTSVPWPPRCTGRTADRGHLESTSLCVEH